MIYLAFVLVIFGLIALAAWQLQHFGLREKEWATERSQLLTRLQHPEIVPPPVFPNVGPDEVTDFQVPLVPESDDIDLVGTVQTFDGDQN